MCKLGIISRRISKKISMSDVLRFITQNDMPDMHVDELPWEPHEWIKIRRHTAEIRL